MSEQQSQEVFSRALASHQSGKLGEAEALYRLVLEKAPRHTGALTLLGTLQAQLRNLEEAARLFEISLKVDPLQVNALYNHGIVLEELARFDDAVDSYDRALALAADSPEIFNNRGNALAKLKRFAEAVASYDRAIALKADFPDAHFNRGNALAELKRFGDALESYERAIAIAPGRPEAHLARANMLAELKRYDRAVEAYDRAIALDPGNPTILNNRGNALMQLARRYDALDSYERALALRPDYPEALFNRADALSELGRYEDALKSYAGAVSLNPGLAQAFPYVQGSMACTRLRLCDWAACEETIDRIAERCIAGDKVLVPFGSYMLRDSALLQYHCGRNFVEDQNPASRHPVWQGERYAHDRIRLAYVSFDFREHMVAYQLAGIAEHHDRSRFETTALSLYPKAAGAIQERLRNAFERFVDVGDRGDIDVARLVRELEIDVLVDLMGHTRGARMGIFAQRPAPVQVSFNCPGTTGADYLDYLVADRIVVPPEHHPYFTEKAVYLPDTCQPNDSKRPAAGRAPSRGEAGLPERGFVFCSFNTSYKFRPAVFDVWMRLLLKIEDSVLWLSSGNATVIGNLQSEARARGVDPARLIFARRIDRMEDHLARQGLADLFLDTLPYNAQTTAADALWSGLPVLTCLGGALSGRVAASLLAAAGLPELITRSLEEYEALAISLAQDPGRLRQIKDKLAANRLACPLFDTARFTRHLEAAFEQMCRMHRQGEAPRHFAVAPISTAAAG